MKTAADLLREKDAELDRAYEMQLDAWEQREKLRLFEKELEKHIRKLEMEIRDLTIKWQNEIRGKGEGRHE